MLDFNKIQNDTHYILSIDDTLMHGRQTNFCRKKLLSRGNRYFLFRWNVYVFTIEQQRICLHFPCHYLRLQATDRQKLQRNTISIQTIAHEMFLMEKSRYATHCVYRLASTRGRGAFWGTGKHKEDIDKYQQCSPTMRKQTRKTKEPCHKHFVDGFMFPVSCFSRAVSFLLKNQINISKS